MEELLVRRKAGRPATRREELAAYCPESSLYFQVISRRRGQGEPPELMVTGNFDADTLDIEPHAMEGYDDLF